MQFCTFVSSEKDLSLCSKSKLLKEVLLEPVLLSRLGTLSKDRIFSLASQAHKLNLRVVLVWDILMNESLMKDIIHELSMKAIQRYTGVAFAYLGYEELKTSAQTYIDEHVILFSNLLGPIRASDLIPEYKLKQGEAVADIKTEKFYHEYSADLMENYLAEEEILDLRAGFYDKFYKPKKAYTILKFIKDGKVVSHWAKAYRGIVLREIAKAGAETIKAVMNLPIEGLSIQEIQVKENKTEIIYEIG